MDMLKRPDAAELTETGRFYLQVGYNELFELGQSAWSGASYYPSEHVIKEIDNGIEVIDTNGHVIKRVSPDKKSVVIARPKKQLDAITEYLKDTADEERIKTRPLWLEPIPSVIFLEQIVSKYSVKSHKFELNPTIGEYDDPVHQRQCVLRLPISSEGNVIVYGVAGSGKTSFINAMIYSLLHEHTPDEVNLYILDFASETLRAFSRAPHVGDVVLSYEAEKISNLFKMLQSEVERRKKLFVDYGGDYDSYVKLSGQAMASIVVVIANFSAFTETYPEKEEAVSYLSREGTKYGVYFVLTALGAGSVRFRLLQNFKQQLVLQLNDDSDYSTIVGKTNGLFPSKYKGRGLVKLDSIYEFQVAYLTKDEVPLAFIQGSCKELSDAWHGRRAERIPVLPDRVDNEFIAEYLDSSNKMRIPVGVEKNSLAVHYYPFDNSYITMVMSSGDECYSFANDIVSLMGSYTDVNGFVFNRTAVMINNAGNMSVCSAVKDCESRIDELFETVKYRNNSYKDAVENGEKPEQFDGIFVVINSLEMLNVSLSDLGKEKLSLILEKGSAAYGINIMIAETLKNVSSFSYEKWYKSNVSQSDGIWIGRGIADQYQMKPNKTTAETREEITSEFGYSLINGKCVRLKLLNNNPEENGYEQ